MDESTLNIKLEPLQKKVDQLNALIEAEEEKVGWQEAMAFEKSLAPELAATYREMVKVLIQAGLLDEATSALSKSTTWYERINEYDEIAENTLILARMQEMEGHYDWAEPTLRLAVWHAREKKAYYEDELEAFYKRREREKPY